MKQIIALDFDGVIHSYKSGWKGPRNIPDPPVAGAIEWIEQFIMEMCDVPESIAAMSPEGKYKLVIFSSRSVYFGGRSAMKKWLVKHGLDKRFLEVIDFPIFKPPSLVLLDDRAVRFTGTFPSPKELVNTRPWYK